MLDLFAPIKCLLQEEPVRVDNVVFRLHSRVTVFLLLVCTVLVTAKQYIGEPISCMTDASIGTNPANLFWLTRIYAKCTREISRITPVLVHGSGVRNDRP